jgi:hypothetical protein
MNYNNKISIIAALTAILIISILAMVSLSSNQVSAQKCQTNLTLVVPLGVYGFDKGPVPVDFSGELKCGDSGISGDTITDTYRR